MATAENCWLPVMAAGSMDPTINQLCQRKVEEKESGMHTLVIGNHDCDDNGISIEVVTGNQCLARKSQWDIAGIVCCNF
jgi:hypothetical protein